MTDLQEAMMRLDLFITQKMREHNIPAMTIGVTDHERTMFLQSEGLGDVGARLPLFKQNLLQIGSIGKVFTAILVMQQVEAGTIDLHAPITDYLPWFKLKNTATITVHHLLTHTAGLISGTDQTGEHQYEVYLLRDTENTTPPGAYFHYSNVGYKALTLILEKVTGSPYGDLVQEHLLDPLGMENSLPVITHQDRHRLAIGYTHLYDDRPPLYGYPIAPAPWFEYGYGDGSIVSNAADMTRFIRFLLQRGITENGDALITDASFDLITTRHTEAFGSHHYGYGIIISEFDGFTHYGHGGQMPGFSSMLLIDAHNQLGIIVLTNHSSSDSFSIAHIGLGLIRAARAHMPLPRLPDIAVPSVVKNAEEFAGVYTAPDNHTLTIIAEGRHIYLQLDREDVQLYQWHKDYFVVTKQDYSSDAFHFVRNDDGVITEVMYGAAWYVADDYKGETTFDTPEQWHSYVGRYRSHNFWNPTFKIIIRKGQLLIVFGTGKPQPLHHVDDNVFRTDDDERSPERLSFDTLIDGRAMRAVLSGAPYYRFFTP